MKTKIINHYGKGCAETAAKSIGIKPTTLRMWPDKPTHNQINMVIAELHRQGKEVPKWLMK